MTILITGGSKGIGLALAHRFAEQGHDLVLIARDKTTLVAESERIRERFGVVVTAIRMDLSAGSSHTLKAKLDAKDISITGLVNNAGAGYRGRFVDMDTKARDLIELNVVSLTELTRTFLKDIERADGFVMTIASVAGFVPVPKMAVYAATKAYVISFTESLSFETSARVLCICPGPVDTAFHDRAQSGSLRVGSRSADEVADRAMRALKGKRIVVVTDGKYRFLLVLSRFMPRSLIRMIAKAMMRE